MSISFHQLSSVREAWLKGTPPTQVAQVLRLSLHTVIAEYVRLDSL